MLFWIFLLVFFIYLYSISKMNRWPQTPSDFLFGSLLRSWLLVFLVFFTILNIWGMFETTSAKSRLALYGISNYDTGKAEFDLLFWKNLSFYGFTVDTSSISWYKKE